jgi:hypothetical protein
MPNGWRNGARAALGFLVEAVGPPAQMPATDFER